MTKFNLIAVSNMDDGSAAIKSIEQARDWAL